MTLRDLIKGSLRLIGVIAESETPGASQLQDSLEAAQLMIESWSTERLMLNKLKREVLELTAGKESYLIGPGGDLVTSAPMEIIRAAYGDLRKVPIYETPEPTEEDPEPAPVLVGYDLFVDSENPVEIVNYQGWARISDKTHSADLVTKIYPEGTSPQEIIHVYPAPRSGKGLVLYSKKAIDAVADVDEELALPLGYARAIKYNLALEIAPEFGIEPSALIVKVANESKANIKSQNRKTPFMKSDFLTGKRFNIYTGDYEV